MAVMSHAELDVWFKAAAATELDTFDKTVGVSITINGLKTNGTANPSVANTPWSETHWVYKTWSLGYDTSVFNDDLDAGIGSGLVAESQDVAASVSNAVKSAVDKIEATLGSAFPAWSVTVCHGSCHNSCHTSRGRR